MLSTITAKVRRFRTRLLMRSALSAGILYRVLSRSIGNRFDDRAEEWDQMVGEHAHKWFDPLDAALDRIPEDWSPERVLDIGGGTGRAGYHIAQRYPVSEVTVIDIAPRMLAFGKNRHKSENLPIISFVAGDSTAIPIRSALVDLAFILNAPFNPSEMARVLRHGGVAILAFTYGHYTPMYLDERTSRSALKRAGFRNFQSGVAGEGSWVMGILDKSQSS